MGRLVAIATVLVLVLPLAACGSDDGTSATTEPTDASVPTTLAENTTTVDGSAPTSPSTTSPTEAETMFGWLRSFEDTGSAIVVAVDPAEMLTGEAAPAAAREDGVLGQDEDLPNDFYIRNPDDATVEFTVSPSVVVTLQACYPDGECVTTEEVDLNTWSVLLGAGRGRPTDPGLGWDWYGAGTLPYEFTLESKVITQVEEQYLP